MTALHHPTKHIPRTFSNNGKNNGRDVLPAKGKKGGYFERDKHENFVFMLIKFLLHTKFGSVFENTSCRSLLCWPFYVIKFFYNYFVDIQWLFCCLLYLFLK